MTNDTLILNLTRYVICVAQLLDLSVAAGMHQEAHDMIYRHGEWGVAIELIIDWIGGLGLHVDRSQLEAFDQAMSTTGWGNSNRMQ